MRLQGALEGDGTTEDPSSHSVIRCVVVPEGAENPDQANSPQQSSGCWLWTDWAGG